MRIFVRRELPDPKEAIRRKAIVRLKKQVPARLHGLNIYLRDLAAKTAEKYAKCTSEVRLEAHHAAVRDHAEHYRALPSHVKDMYEHTAEKEVLEKEQALFDEYESERNALQLYVQVRETGKREPKPLVLSSMRLADEELPALQRMWDDHVKFSKKRVDELREKALRPVNRPSIDIQTQLIACNSHIPAHVHCQHWVSLICRTRDVTLGQVLLRIGNEDDDSDVFLIARISCQPYKLGLLPLTLRPKPRQPPDIASFEQMRRVTHEWDFVAARAAYIKDTDLEGYATDDMWIIPFTHFDGSHNVWSDGDPIEIVEWARMAHATVDPAIHAAPEPDAVIPPDQEKHWEEQLKRRRTMKTAPHVSETEAKRLGNIDEIDLADVAEIIANEKGCWLVLTLCLNGISDWRRAVGVGQPSSKRKSSIVGEPRQRTTEPTTF